MSRLAAVAAAAVAAAAGEEEEAAGAKASGYRPDPKGNQGC